MFSNTPQYPDDVLRSIRIRNSEGLLHNLYGPAEIQFHRDGTKSAYWFINGEYHREDGPAIVTYDQENRPDRGLYCLDGHRFNHILEYKETIEYRKKNPKVEQQSLGSYDPKIVVDIFDEGDRVRIVANAYDPFFKMIMQQEKSIW